MKTTLTLVLLIISAANMFSADDYSKYYNNLPVEMPVVTTPTIPSNTISLKDMNGVGDGVTLNTQAFKDAISKLTEMGGGQLVVPAGIYVTGYIELKSNIDLHLEKNAMILFSANKEDMIDRNAKVTKPTKMAKPGISAIRCQNVSITGEGMIDGNGQWWRPVKRSKVSDVEWNTFKRMGGSIEEDGSIWYPYNLKHFKNITTNRKDEAVIRNYMIRFIECENVMVKGVTIKNSPNFHLVPQRCNNVIIDGVNITCPWNVQNGDGIDIGNSKNVLIVNNTVSVGDDGICMKGGNGQTGKDHGPCENILIQDNIVYRAHGGFVIGSDVSGGMKKIVVRNNTFSGTDTGLRFKSMMGRGGKTEQIYISDIFMNGIKNEAIVFETTYVNKVAGAGAAAANVAEDFAPEFNDINISNVVCSSAKIGISAKGEKGMVSNINIKNTTIFYTDKASTIDPACDVKLDNVRFETFK